MTRIIDEVLEWGDPRHGVNGYINYKCPCSVCQVAHAQYHQDRRAAGKVKKKRKNIMEDVYGQCLDCGAIEVKLDSKYGIQDLSFMGEDPKYPYGKPCEVCKDKPFRWRSATAPDGWVRGTTFGRVV